MMLSFTAVMRCYCWHSFTRIPLLFY